MPDSAVKRLDLEPAAVTAMTDLLPTVSADVVAAIIAEVPSYSRAFQGPMGVTIEAAVALALKGFLDRLSRHGPGATSIGDAVRKGSYNLGRGEARSGRTTDALLSAYRVGTRVSWLALSQAAVDLGLSAEKMAGFAEGVFAYIDELSAYSVAGHDDELKISGRVQERLRERLGRLLLTGAAPDAIVTAALRAEWRQPEQITVLLIPPADLRPSLNALGRRGTRALVMSEDVPKLPEDKVAVLIPDGSHTSMRAVLRDVQGTLGPPRPWLRAAESFALALRTREFRTGRGLLDTNDHLARLLLDSDPGLREALRESALAPLDGLKPAARTKLEETLRAWVLCLGRRDDAADLLFVHPQTIRYRMTQIRDLYGDRLNDPVVVRDLVLALG